MRDAPAPPPVGLPTALASLASLYADLQARQAIGMPTNPQARSLAAAMDAIHLRIAALQTTAISEPIAADRIAQAILSAGVSTEVMQEIRTRSAQAHQDLSSLLSCAIERAPDYDRMQQLSSLEAAGRLGDGFQLQGDRFLAAVTRSTHLGQRVRHRDVRQQVAEIQDRVHQRYGAQSAAIIPGLIILSNGTVEAIDRLCREWCRIEEHPKSTHDNPFRILARFIAIFSDVSQHVITRSLHHGTQEPHTHAAAAPRTALATLKYAGSVLAQIITSRELALLEDLDEHAVTEQLFSSLAQYNATEPSKQNRHPWYWGKNLERGIYDPRQISALLTSEVPRMQLAQIFTDLNNLAAVKGGLVDVPNEINRPPSGQDRSVPHEQSARAEALKRIYHVMSLGKVPMPPELALRLFNFSLLQGGPTTASEQCVRLIEGLRKAHTIAEDQRSPLEQTMLFRTLAILLQRQDREMPLDLPLTSTKLAGTTPRELLVQLANMAFPTDVIRGTTRPNPSTPAEEMYTPPDALEQAEQMYCDSATVGLLRRYYADAARRWSDAQGGRWPERFAVSYRSFARACGRMFNVTHVSPLAVTRGGGATCETHSPAYTPFVYPSATTAFHAYLEQLEPDPAKRRIVMSDQEYGTLVGRKESCVAEGGRIADLKTVSLWDEEEQRLRTGEELAEALLKVMDDATTLVVLSSLTRFGEVPCGSVQELGRALKIIRARRDGQKHIPILIDGAQALFRLSAAKQINTLQPDAWLGSGTKIAGAGQIGFISLRNGTLAGKEDGVPFAYDASTVSLEGMFILERLMHNASLRGSNLRRYGQPAVLGPDVAAPNVEDEHLERLQYLTSLTLEHALEHGGRIWAEIQKQVLCEPEELQQQLFSVWQRMRQQDKKTGSRQIASLLFHSRIRADRERGTTLFRQQLGVLETMARAADLRELNPRETDAFGSALFGMNIRCPSHLNTDAYGGIVTASLPSVSGRALATELPKYHGIRLAACGPKQRLIRISLDDRQPAEVVRRLFEAIGKTQIHYALPRLQEKRPLRAVFDIAAEDAK